MTYIVIESTPGYLPENDDPGEFDTYADAVAHANELADELEEQGYTCDRSWASRQNTYAIICQLPRESVVRYIEVIEDES